MILEYFPFLAAFLYGLVIGSFLNVCIHRLPRSGFMEEERFECPHCEKEILEIPCPFCKEIIKDDEESPSLPEPSKSMGAVRSKCPKCGELIRYYDNIPVVSYILLKGKCRQCKISISLRYPVVELLSALFAVAVLARFGLSLTALFVYLFIACLMVLSFIDIDFQRIPKVVTYPGMLAGLMVSSLVTDLGFLAALEGLLCGAGGIYILQQSYFLIRKREGLGLGDADLMAMVGAFTGIAGVVFTVMAGAFFGMGAGVVMAAGGKGGLKKRLPFGPFLAMGAFVYIFWGPRIIEWYLGLYKHAGI